MWVVLNTGLVDVDDDTLCDNRSVTTCAPRLQSDYHVLTHTHNEREGKERKEGAERTRNGEMEEIKGM